MAKKKKTLVVESGNNVKVHYKGTLNDGTIFDSSYDRDETLTFQVGSGQMIPGFDSAVPGMKVGEKKSVKLTPDVAYGPINEGAFQKISKSAFPEDFSFVVGSVVEGQNQSGQQLIARISSLEEDEVTLDFNHPMAGKELNFEIELVEIEK